MERNEADLRRAIVEKCRWMNRAGLNQGTSGNISVRRGETLLITPSGIPYETLEPDMIAEMPLAGDGAWHGPLPPSTEWRFHRDILRHRPEIGAVVHTHSTYATVLAIARRDIPACHYMIAAFGGATIRCAGYAPFGSEDLSREAVAALEGRLGCLLANHGMIALGADLGRAMWHAVELETLARQYYLSLPLGPVLLSESEIAEAARRFAGYGLRSATGGEAGPNRAPPAKKPRRGAGRAGSSLGRKRPTRASPAMAEGEEESRSRAR